MLTSIFFPSILFSLKVGIIMSPNQSKIFIMGDFKAFRYNNFTSSSSFKPSNLFKGEIYSVMKKVNLKSSPGPFSFAYRLCTLSPMNLSQL